MGKEIKIKLPDNMPDVEEIIGGCSDKKSGGSGCLSVIVVVVLVTIATLS